MTTDTFDRYILRGFSAPFHVVLRLSSHTGHRPEWDTRSEKDTNQRGDDVATSTKIVGLSVVTAALVGAGTAVAVMAVTDDSSRKVEARDLRGISVVTPTTAVESAIGSMADVESAPSDTLPETRTVSPSGVAAVPVPTLNAGRGVVPGLDEISGVLDYRGDDFRLDGREIDMGPDRWLTNTVASGDLDGDGTVETWWLELSGSIGRSVTVLGDVDDDDIDVYEINGLTVRPLYSEIAPWSDEWNAIDVPATIEEVLASGLTADDAVRLALEQVAGVAIDVQLDINDGRPYWEVDIRSLDGDLYDIEIDALTGRIVEIDRA